MTPQRRTEIEQIANRFGSSNCWTGTTGTLAAIIRELLAEIDTQNVVECSPPFEDSDRWPGG